MIAILCATLLLLPLPSIGVGRAAEAVAPADHLWVRQCVTGPDHKEACFLQQFVLSMPQGTALLKVVFGYLGEGGKPRMEVTTPLGILLQPGLILTVDGHAPVTLPLAFCQTGGCLAVVDLDEEALNQFRNGKQAKLRYVTQERTALDLPLRLDGLAAALKTIAP